MEYNVPITFSLKILSDLANSQTDEFGEDNYVFMYMNEEIIINKETQDLKLVDVLENDEDNAGGRYEIECFEIKADWFTKNEVIVKNATNRKLKIKLNYQTKEFTKEKDTK